MWQKRISWNLTNRNLISIEMIIIFIIHHHHYYNCDRISLKVFCVCVCVKYNIFPSLRSFFFRIDIDIISTGNNYKELCRQNRWTTFNCRSISKCARKKCTWMRSERVIMHTLTTTIKQMNTYIEIYSLTFVFIRSNL